MKMAAILTNASGNDSNTHAATGTTQLIASGDFLDGVISIQIEADALPPAEVLVFRGEGAKTLNLASGTTITATVKGANANMSVNLTALP